MSTDDDRPRAAGGYSDSGLYNSGESYPSAGQSYGGQGYGSQMPDDSSSLYDDAGFANQQTSVLPGAPSGAGSEFDFGSDLDTDTEEADRRSVQWHGGLDFGLLVLRLAIGGFFIVHGLDKLFGWFTDQGGMGNTEQMLAGFNFTEPKILAWVTALSETAGGALLVLGLFTPAGAAAILGVMANVIVVKADWNEFFGNVELEMTYAAVVFALLFTGPGRVALDRHTHWFRKAPAYGFVFLILAAGASVVTLVVFR